MFVYLYLSGFFMRKFKLKALKKIKNEQEQIRKDIFLIKLKPTQVIAFIA